MRPPVCVRMAGVRAFVVLRYRMRGQLACALSCMCAACVRVYDAAYVAVLHVHSRLCVTVLRASMDVVIRVLAVPSIFHASFPDFPPVPGRYINIKYL